MLEVRRGVMVKALKWVAVAVIAVELLLVATGILDLTHAIIIAIGLEVLCGVLALGLAVTARAIYRRLRESGVTRWDAFLQAAGTVLPGPVVTLLRHEIGGFMSIVLLLRRKQDVPEGATVIRYGASQKTFLIVMMGLTPVEIVIVELLLPWLWLRIVLLIAALYGLVWMFGFYAGVRTRPHYVDAHRLVMRTGHLAAASVDAGAIRSVQRENHEQYKGFVSVVDDVVAVPGMNGTSLTVTLEPETPVRIQGRGTVYASEVRFDADEVDTAVRAIHEFTELPRD